MTVNWITGAKMPSEIILTTLNARYIHSSFALRYLYANLGDLQTTTEIQEFTINQLAMEIAGQLLSATPKIIGFSVYIWNVVETKAVIAIIRQVAPGICIVLGGPEVSFKQDQPDICSLADYVVGGPGEISFPQLCNDYLKGLKPLECFVPGIAVNLDNLKLPYDLYTDQDIASRIVYVEASRGCPFKCEFCLSSLDKTAVPFELERFLDEMDRLHRRGARNFKFIDRTFNLKVATSVAILEFFLERMSDDLYLHFEVIPDNLPEKLKVVLPRFPAGRLQFEIGVQTFDPAIQKTINRRQDNVKTVENIRWLRENTGAHIHTDLIFGLPGDSLDNFAASFDQLIEINPQEIQMGILKRLRGAPLNRHTEEFDMRYNPLPPYSILSNRDVSFDDLQRVTRFARYWDMIGNSGRFSSSLPLLMGENPFVRFMALSDALYNVEGRTWKIALRRLFGLIAKIASDDSDIDSNAILASLKEDFERSGEKGRFETVLIQPSTSRLGVANRRQKQHKVLELTGS
ncbi:MAG: radical SAM superfamily enzyme YgiQ (UPF0313 family) [Gammaproteobacteria bacterium]|jgi:radical SAM superfamily enzyme YgiQ (UPF0313 family)